MDSDILKIVISASIGGLITFLVTFVNYRMKKYELAFTYSKKLEEKYMENARKFASEVYLPIFRITNEAEELLDAKDLSEVSIQSIEDSLNKHIRNINDTGFTAYLTSNVEIEIKQFIKFLNKSRTSNRISYGIYFQYHVFGNGVNQYFEVNSDQLRDSKKMLRSHRMMIKIYKFITGTNIIFGAGRLIDFGQQIVLNSAPIDSDDFQFQAKRYILNIKEKVRQITLG